MIDASIEEQLAYAASHVWQKNELRPNQVEAVHKLVYDGESQGKLLVVDRTGAGKSLILQLSAVCVGGIIYVCIPLLALTANQIAKIKLALQTQGRVRCYHLDETNPKSVREKLIPRMDAFDPDSSTTMFVLSSPQYLADNVEFRECLLRCHKRHTLRMVVLDEVHLYSMHGQTFRECIRYLTNAFFAKVFASGNTYTPLFLSMTATMTIPLLNTFSSLTSFDWNSKSHQLWAPFSSFRQRYIKMTFDVTGDIKQVAFPRLVTHLVRNKDSYAAMYVNFKQECLTWAGDLQKKLAVALLDDENERKIDIIQINGDMDKEEKFRFIRLFTGDEVMPGTNPQVLCATAAANTGVDQERLDWVLRIGLPRCILTLLQERGRNARKLGMKGMFQLFTSWKLFVALLLSILAPRNQDHVEPEDGGSVNTMIRALSPMKGRKSSTNKYNCPLSSVQKHNNTVAAHNSLMDVLKLCFLPGLGCIHCRTEWFMATGKLDTFPEVMLPCVKQCFVCDDTIYKYILPVVFDGAMEFLKSRRLTDSLPWELTNANCEELIDLLDKDADWKTRVFGIASVSKFSCASFFFQLLATGMLSLEWKGGKAMVVLTRDNSGSAFEYVYENKLYWEGFTFRTAATGHARRSISWQEFITGKAECTSSDVGTIYPRLDD